MTTITLPIKCSTAKTIYKYVPLVTVVAWGASAFIMGVWIYVINKVDVTLAFSSNLFLNLCALGFFTIGWLFFGALIITCIIIIGVEITKRILKFQCIKDGEE